MTRSKRGCVCTLDKDTMMFADFPEGVSLEAEPDSGLADTAFDDVVVERLMGVASHLVELGVGFVGCQKCIHPQVKDYLREKVSA